MTINNNTTIETLISLGLVSDAQVEKWNKRVEREESRNQSKKLVQGTADAIKGGDDYVKSVNFKVARSKLLRKIAKDKDKKKVTPKKTKTTAMRGGGLARSGAASLSGYKVR